MDGPSSTPAANAGLPIVASFEPVWNVTDSSLMHSLKQKPPMDSTEDGIQIDGNETQKQSV
jgi:hypothetical protein